MANCPCGSGKEYRECCEPLINGSIKPERAEQLMRARYTAHTNASIQYVLDTHHPDKRHEVDEAQTRAWAEKSEWLGIDIRHVADGEGKADTAEIEFIATYRDPKGLRQTHHELSEFRKKDGEWYFYDAKPPQIEQFRRDQPKVGRNEPCPCGSGKKFKKCCGKAA